MRYYVDLPVPFERAEEAMLEEPNAWVPAIARGAESRGDGLLAEIGFGPRHLRLDKKVEVALEPPHRLGRKTLVPMSWQAADADRLFPRLDADIELTAMGLDRTQLAISARYRPPLGAVGRVVDRAMLHLVAEATIKDFLDGVAEKLKRELAAEVDG
ncbi:MAG: hypothetical protein ACJ76P_08430 [Actinomycetota bacterium]